MTRCLAGLVALTLAACTLEAGEGFATMESAELSVLLDPASARIDGHAVLTDLGYRVELESFEIDVGAIELQELEGGGGGGGTFDPANPPPGYSLCHGGHCHHESGALVSYEEIQAELAGGTVTYAPMVTVPVEQTVDVVAGETVTLGRFEPSPELPRGTVSRVFVPVDAIRLSGSVTGADLGPDAADVAVDLPVTGGFVATVSREIDRDEPPEIELAVTVPIGGSLFDGVDFASGSTDATALAAAVLGNDIDVSFD